MYKIKKTMILAAGLGTRLRPLTNTKPKPLIEVGDRALIEYNILLLKHYDIKEIVINISYLKDKIKDFLGDGKKLGVNISYSEEDPILGTGGGIRKALQFFDGPFLVLNSDSIIDINLNEFIQFHNKHKCEASLVLRNRKKGETYTPVELAKDMVKGFGTGEYMYSGVQILSPHLVERLHDGKFSDIVSDLYIPMLRQGKNISGYIYDGYWSDIGTIATLEQARTDFQTRKFKLHFLK